MNSWCGGWLLVALGCLGVFAGIGRAAEKDYAPLRRDMQAGDRYVLSADALHPTQFSLGFREVRHKREKFDAMSAAEAVKELKKKNVPVVIGPGGVVYMTDGHHTIRSLIESKQSAKQVYGTVIANWQELPVGEFWRRMESNNYANLQEPDGSRGHPGDLPANLKAMKSDIYRGLAWAVLKADGFAERKDVYFQEFRWADFFRTRVQWDDTSNGDFARATAEAVKLARSPAAAKLPGYLGRP